MTINQPKDTYIGRLFLVSVCILIVFLLLQLDDEIRAQIRSWIQATGSFSIAIAVAYWTRKNQEKDKREEQQQKEARDKELKERQEESDYKEYLNQIVSLLIKYNFNQPIEHSIDFKILQHFFCDYCKRIQNRKKKPNYILFSRYKYFKEQKNTYF